MSRSELPHLLRDALVAAEFTYDHVAELLGGDAHAALGRNETTPGMRRTTGGSPLETLTRLFLLQAPVSGEEAERALPGLVDRLCVEGLLEQSIGEVAARLDVRPYAAPEAGGDLWVVSDLTPGLDGSPNRVDADHVLGISSASTSLAQLTLRDPVERALDLGTGCGVQALHLARHCGVVVATDVNRRALWMTEFNAALNDIEPERIDVRDGSFFEPVRDERFDLIATNPPFVISPATGERLVYRDSGLPGDRVVEDIVRAAPDHLTPGGWCQVLANWVIAREVPWEERLGNWIVPPADSERAPCDVLVVQREVLDPAAYVELWLKDAGQQGTADYVRRYDTWLSWFDEQGIEGIGFGWINLRAPGNAGRHTDGRLLPANRMTSAFLDWPYDVEQPVAPAIGAWGEAVDLLRELGDDEDLLVARLVANPELQQETVGVPGAADPEAVVLRQRRGLRRARQVDTVEAALVGACGGDLSVGQILDAVADLLDLDPAATRTRYLPAVRELIAEGFLSLP